MWRKIVMTGLLLISTVAVSAQTTTFSIANSDFQVSTVFNEVGVFNFSMEINAPLAAGVYNNPEIVSLTYQVMGVLTTTTPSGFPSFNLQRTMTGAQFYAQGSSLSFEISNAAVLSDGVQAAELVGGGVVFTFNGRENDNGRFHPALFELRADGTGRIQNSDNIVTETPFLQVSFGDEYITDLMFDPGNTTLFTANPAPVPPVQLGSGGGGASSFWTLAILLTLYAWRFRRARHRAAA